MADEVSLTRREMNGLPAAEALAMLEATEHRRARRSFTGAPLLASEMEALSMLAEAWRPWPGARFAVIAEAPPSLFMGVVGAFGGVSGSPSAMAFVGSGPAETVGYTGEGAVLAATAAGLQTCWVAGVFRPGVVEALVPLAEGERVFAVSALGHSPAVASAKERLVFGANRLKKRRPLEEIAPGHESWPAWARAAVEVARIAPSAMNRQPWRFALTDEGLLVSTYAAELPRAPRRLDCGIAMLHAELGAFGEGVTGAWRLLDAPGVGLFVPDDG